MLRALSTHVKHDDDAAGGEGGLTITYYVYTSRLLFELIADPAISGMMKSLEPVAHVSFFCSPLWVVAVSPMLRYRRCGLALSCAPVPKYAL